MIKIVIVHGDDFIKIQKRVCYFKKYAKLKGWKINHVNLKEGTSISEQIVKKDLFEKESLNILENIKNLKTEDYEWINNNYQNYDLRLFLYQYNILGKNILNKFPKDCKIEEYKVFNLLWVFLDSFFPGNLNNSLKLFNEVIKNEPVEFVFAMLARQIRDIYWVKTDSETTSIPPWRIKKLKNLASKYKEEEIISLINDMSQADIKSKTSKSDISRSLDLIMIKYLE